MGSKWGQCAGSSSEKKLEEGLGPRVGTFFHGRY